jgi:hypothetical protein
MDQSLELKNALCEVRKAYRLIATYQRRILDITRIIQNTLGLKPYCYDHNYYNIRGRAFPTDRWSIDFLPLYNGMSILFLNEGADSNHPKVDDIMLDVRFENDTGFERSSTKEPRPEEFETSVEDSESKLCLYAFGVTEDMPNTNFYNIIWHQMEYAGNEQYEEYEKFWNLGKSYDLSILPDEDSIKEMLEDFRALLKENKIKSVQSI